MAKSSLIKRMRSIFQISDPQIKAPFPISTKALQREYVPTANKYFFQNLTFPSFIDPMRIRRDIRRYVWVLERMMLDDKLKAAHDFKVTSVLASGWEIQPASEVPRDVQIADFVTDNLESLDIPFDDFLRNFCDAWNYGYKLAEKIYYIKDGLFYLKNIKCKPSKVLRFNVDDFSNLTSVQYVLGNMQELIPPEKFIIYVNPYLKDGEWYGEPDLVAVYREWWSKDTLVKIRNIAARTHAMPIRVLLYDEATTPDDLNKMKGEVDDIHENLALYIPAKRAEDGTGKLIPLVELSFLESARTTTPEFNAIIEQLDNAMLHRLLIGDKLGLSPSNASASDGKSNSGGSKALAQVHFDLYMNGIIKFLRHHIENLIQEQLIKQLVALNFKVDKYPQFKFKVEDDTLMARVQVVALAVQWGLVDASAPWVIEYLHFPVAAESLATTNKNISSDTGTIAEANAVEDEKIKEQQAQEAQTGAAGPMAPTDTLPYESENFGGPGSGRFPAGSHEAQADEYLNNALNLQAQVFGRVKHTPEKLQELKNQRNVALKQAKGYIKQVSDKNTQRDLIARHDNLATKENRIGLYVEKENWSAKFSKVCNFARMEKGLNEAETKCVNRLVDIFKEIRTDLLQKSKKLHEIGKKDGIKAFKGSILAELKDTYQKFFTQCYVNGQNEAKDEIAKGKKTNGNFKYQEINYALPFDSAVRFFSLNKTQMDAIRQRAFYITGIEQDEVLKKVNQILLDDIGTASVQDTMKSVEDVLAPYLETGSIDESVADPWLLQTIVRTNESEMFNMGRMAEFNNPDLDGFVQAYEYSAVMDDRTTEFCSEHDGQCLEAGDDRVDEFPPAHYNCRSIWAPVFRGEDYDNNWDDSIKPMDGFAVKWRGK